MAAQVPGGAPVETPRSVPGLIARRAMAMTFIRGRALSQLAAEMSARGITPGSPAATLLGRRLLRALTDAYGAMLLGEGFFHGDPHPGNIMITDDGKASIVSYRIVSRASRIAHYARTRRALTSRRSRRWRWSTSGR